MYLILHIFAFLRFNLAKVFRLPALADDKPCVRCCSERGIFFATTLWHICRTRDVVATQGDPGHIGAHTSTLPITIEQHSESRTTKQRNHRINQQTHHNRHHCNTTKPPTPPCLPASNSPVFPLTPTAAIRNPSLCGHPLQSRHLPTHPH